VNLATYLEVLICTKTSLGGSMVTRPKRNFSPEFRLEAAQLVVDQHYTVREAAEAMNVGYSSMDKWVRQLRQERDGQSPKATPMTPDQLRIRELEKRIRDIEMEKDILKNRYGLAPACRYRNPTAPYTQLGCQGRSRWLFGGRPR